jgi:enoyl-CoA hydratase/carnithine racemase
MGTVHFDVVDGVARMVLDNPAVHNAVDAPMRAALQDAYREVESNDGIRVAVISGSVEGRSFCSGGYIDGYQEAGSFGPEGAGPPPIPRPWPVWKPFIAAIRGYAVGGGFALALTCDLRVVGRKAPIGPSGLRRGVVQGAGQSQRLSRLVGMSKALELLLLSSYVDGEEAGRIGLANLVVDDDSVEDSAMEWARTIASYDPWTVARTKELVHRGFDMPVDDALAWEADVALEGYRRPEAEAGFNAFTESRAANAEVAPDEDQG